MGARGCFSEDVRRPRAIGRIEEAHTMVQHRQATGWIWAGLLVTIASIVGGAGWAVAAEVGQPAPDFKLPGTMGADVALSDFRDKKWVLLEFYGADFVPT
jgi:hypothetical protein